MYDKKMEGRNERKETEKCMTKKWKAEIGGRRQKNGSAGDRKMYDKKMEGRNRRKETKNGRQKCEEDKMKNEVMAERLEAV